MQTLDAPVYEIKKESNWYKQKTKQKEQQNAFFKEINTYFPNNGFSYYHSEWFGVQGDSEDYETYKNEVKKNPDKNGVHIIKKRSKYFPIFKDMLEKIEEISPFKTHDTFGLNNVSASQWIGDRWFFGVKHPEYIKNHEEITPVDYKDYLNIVVETLGDTR